MTENRSPDRITGLEDASADDAADVLLRSFFDYPIWPWMLPDEAERRRAMSWFMRLCVRDAAADGHGYLAATEGVVQGVAIWEPQTGEAATVESSAREPSDWDELPSRMGAAAMDRMNAMVETQRPIRERTMADAPFWYLPWLGVDPDVQRSGVGGALLRHTLSRLDGDGIATCLETEKEANVAYYEQHGFRVVAHGDLPLGGPHFWTMRRG